VGREGGGKNISGAAEKSNKSHQSEGRKKGKHTSLQEKGGEKRGSGKKELKVFLSQAGRVKGKTKNCATCATSERKEGEKKSAHKRTAHWEIWGSEEEKKVETTEYWSARRKERKKKRPHVADPSKKRKRKKKTQHPPPPPRGKREKRGETPAYDVELSLGKKRGKVALSFEKEGKKKKGKSRGPERIGSPNYFNEYKISSKLAGEEEKKLLARRKRRSQPQCCQRMRSAHYFNQE